MRVSWTADCYGSTGLEHLVRQGVLVLEQDQWDVADTVANDTETSASRPLQQGSIVYGIAFGPRAGRKVLTLREALPIDIETYYESKPLCANEQSFCLHPAVRPIHTRSTVVCGIRNRALIRHIRFIARFSR
jgi:hypothetical protein